MQKYLRSLKKEISELISLLKGKRRYTIELNKRKNGERIRRVRSSMINLIITLMKMKLKLKCTRKMPIFSIIGN